MSRPTTDGYVHHALFFGSDAELVQVAVPFLREGLATGDAVVLACEAPRNRLLADALGETPGSGSWSAPGPTCGPRSRWRPTGG
jgi:hypothetical protein